MIILPTNSVKDTGYDVDNSLRFNKGSSDHLSITPSSAGSLQKYTFSAWVKRSNLGANSTLFGARVDANTNFFITFRDEDDISIKNKIGGTTTTLLTNRLFRDPSAWYHVVVAMDTTQGTASNRTKIYINGVQETSFATEQYPAENGNTAVNQTVEHNVGDDVSDSGFFNGYMAEVVFINNQQLDPTSFGEFDEDSGIWKPINVSGLTFGTNGFYLDFENSGALGADVSGNTNNFTVNNLTAIDQSTDTCTNNFATWNPLILTETVTFSDGNLSMVKGATQYRGTLTTMIVEKGKWYAEIKVTNAVDLQIGFMRADTLQDGARSIYLASSNIYWQDSNSTIAYTLNNGNQGNVTVTGGSNSVSTYTTNDIIMLALDMDNGLAWFGKNGTWENSGNPASGSNAFNLNSDYTNGIGIYAGLNNASVSANFGSPAYAISSGNTDGDGYGNFEYAVPSGYFSLNTKNLAEYG